MLKFIDGFDHYAPVGTKGTVVTKYLTAAGYDIRNATDTTFSVVDGRRAGACALRFSTVSGATTNASLSWGFTSAASLVVFGFAFQGGGARQRICRIENVVDVDWDTSTGKLKVGTTLGASPLIMNAWYYMELRCDLTNQQVEIWANDELQLTVPWTTGAPAKYTLTWGQTATATATATMDIDDFYGLDSSAGQRVDRLHPVEVATRMPSADITSEWTVVGATGSPAHYTIASQTLALETGKPYLQSNISGQQDTYRSNAVLPSSNQIYGVGIVALARKGDVDNRSIGLKITAGSQTVERQIALTEDFKYYQTTEERAPGNLEWDKNNVESTEFGIVTR